jgi:hypothetical protein
LAISTGRETNPLAGNLVQREILLVRQLMQLAAGLI